MAEWDADDDVGTGINFNFGLSRDEAARIMDPTAEDAQLGDFLIRKSSSGAAYVLVVLMRPKKDTKAPLRLTQTQVFWTEGGNMFADLLDLCEHHNEYTKPVMTKYKDEANPGSTITYESPLLRPRHSSSQGGGGGAGGGAGAAAPPPRPPATKPG
eukprot:gene21334-13394_t